MARRPYSYLMSSHGEICTCILFQVTNPIQLACNDFNNTMIMSEWRRLGDISVTSRWRCCDIKVE